MKTATGFFLLIVLLWGGFAAPTACAQMPDPIERLVIQQTDEVLSFYSVDDAGALTEIMSLPEVCILHAETGRRTCKWTIYEALHIVASPDGQYVAFTARGHGSAALFIYGVRSEPREIALPDDADVLWSPDSTALLLVPPGDYNGSSLFSRAYLYDLATYELTRVPSSEWPWGFEWLPDSDQFLFTARMDDGQFHIFVGSRFDKTAEPFDFNVTPPVESVNCFPDKLTWLPERSRLYYTCQIVSDLWLYSLDLETGEQRLEQDLRAIYPENADYGDIEAIYPDPVGQGVYLIATGFAPVIVSDFGPPPPPPDFWYLVRLDQPDQWEIMAEGHTYWLTDAGVAFNTYRFVISDGTDIVFADDEYFLTVFDTRTGTVSRWTTGAQVDVVQWLDADRLLYTEFTGDYFYLTAPQSTWLLDTRTGETSEFLPGLEGDVWVFPLNFSPNPPSWHVG